MSNSNFGKDMPSWAHCWDGQLNHKLSTNSGYGCHQAQSLPETLMIFYEFIESDAGRHILIDLNDAFYCRSVGVLYSSVLPFLVSYSTSIRSFLFFVLRMAFFVKARSLGCCTLHPYTVHILVHVPEITWILVHPNNKWLFCFANRFRKPSLEPPKRGPSVLYFSLQMSYWNIIWLNHHHLQNNTTLQNWLPSGNLLHSYWKWPSRNSGFTHWTWWFPIVFCMFTRGYIGFYHGFSYGFSYGSCFFPWFSHRNLRPRNISLPADEASELLLVTLKYGRVSKEQLLKDFFGFEKMA